MRDVSGVKYRFYVTKTMNIMMLKLKKLLEILIIHLHLMTNTIMYFYYGYQEEDFNILNKNKLFTLNFSATQELDRKLEVETQANYK